MFVSDVRKCKFAIARANSLDTVGFIYILGTPGQESSLLQPEPPKFDAPQTRSPRPATKISKKGVLASSPYISSTYAKVISSVPPKHLGFTEAASPGIPTPQVPRRIPNQTGAHFPWGSK